MNKLRNIAVALLLGALAGNAQFGQPPGVFNRLITTTNGTPIQITTSHIVVDSLSIQMQHGFTSLGYVCIVAPGVTPASKCTGSGQLAFELAPATSTAPGAQLSYPLPIPGLDLNTVWIDSDVNCGVIVSWHVK